MTRLSTRKNRWMATTILGSAALLLGCANAFAQSEDAIQDDDITETPAAQIDEDASVQEKIVVTGSRLRRDEFTSSSPVQVLTSETSTLQGLVSAAEVLQGASVAAGSGQINNTFTGFVVNGGGGVDTVSLRGLGSQRSLVLLNGRRMPPAGVGGTVGPIDLNTLPNSMIARYEILKDGASSVYGSDAVAGVVNVITRDNIEGFEATGTIELVEDGGAEEYLLGGAWGKSFDRGSLSISGEYYKQKELEYGDRDNFAYPEDRYFDADGNRAAIIASRTGEFKCFQSVEGYGHTCNPFTGACFGSRVPDSTAAGELDSEAVAGYRRIPFAERSNDDPRQLKDSVISPRERVTLFATGDYRPAAFDTTELFGELLFSRRESNQDNHRQLFPWFDGTSPVNDFNTTAFGVGLTARPIVLIPFDQSQEVEVFRALGGARGEFGGSVLNGWNWDAYLSHSISNGTYTRDVVPSDRVDAGTGTIQDTISPNPEGVCGSSAPAGCVPLDLFETDVLFDGNFSPEQAAYYLLSETGETEYTQTIFEAAITGDLFALPAGEIGAAFGVHVRKDEIDDVPGEFGRAGNVWNLLSAVETVGDDAVAEVFGEAEIPILRSQPGFEDLTLNLSARYSSYDSVGDATTYKAGANWQINPTIRLRATYGTSFRAPSLFELFLGDQTSFPSQISVDPCIAYGVQGPESQVVDQVIHNNCAADGLPPDWGGGSSSAEILTGGGLDLDPEESTAQTVGFVFTPSNLDFSLAIDYFDIEIENEIASLAGAVVGRCYRDEDFRNEPGFCDLFERVLDPTAPNFGTITDIDASYRNIPNQKTSGVDITARYETEFDFGALTIDAQATYTDVDEDQEFVGADFISFNGTIGDPEWVGTAQTRFETGDWTTTWTLNYTGVADNNGFESEDQRVDPFYAPNAFNVTKVREFITHDISVRKEWDTLAAIIGVRNVFDTEAPLVSDGDDDGSVSRLGNYPLSSQYYQGYIGRSVFLTLSKEF